MDKNILSIIIPSLNEEANVAIVLNRILELNWPSLGFMPEIIFIDDGSTDNTERIVRDFQSKSNKIIYLKHNVPLGKGKSVVDGVNISSGKYFIIQDADLEYNPKDYIPLFNKLSGSEEKMVVGSRFTKRLLPSYFNKYFLANYFFTWFINAVYAADLTDIWTCYKMLSKNLFLSLNIKSTDFNIEPEIIIKCLKRKVAIEEIPILYRPRTVAEGKKIGWNDGLKAVWAIIKFTFE